MGHVYDSLAPASHSPGRRGLAPDQISRIVSKNETSYCLGTPVAAMMPVYKSISLAMNCRKPSGGR